MSEILVRDLATGKSVTFGEFTVHCSSAKAPWRDLIRLERSRKTLGGIELTSLWTSISVVQAESVAALRVDAGPLRRTMLKPGDVLISPQGASIYVSTEGPLESTCMQLGPAVLRAVAEEMGADASVSSDGAVRDEQVEAVALLLESEIRSGCPSGRLYGEHIAYALGAHLIRCFAAPRSTGVTSRRRLRNAKFAAALEYIQAHAQGDLRLLDLAKAVQLSPFHFTRLFKNSTGFTPHQYVLRWRIEEAKRLLRHSRLDLAEIAHRVGFLDQSHFTLRFRQVTGDTPKRWRDKG